MKNFWKETLFEFWYIEGGKEIPLIGMYGAIFLFEIFLLIKVIIM